MKIAVVTASVGTNDLLNQIKWSDEVDYHAFVEPSKLNFDGIWKRHECVDFSTDVTYKNRRAAKIYKICPHLFLPNYDYYIWLDSTHVLEKNPKEIIEEHLKNNDIAVFEHPERNCVYEEGICVKKINFDHHELVINQLEFYKKMNYPPKNGLYELPARIQRNTRLTQKMGLMWWEQICKFSSRDQISFPFVCHQLKIKPSILPGRANTIRGNNIMPQIIYSPHNRVS